MQTSGYNYTQILPKFIRLSIYSFLTTNEVVFKIAKLGMKERKALVTSKLANKGRQFKMKIDFNDCFICQI